MRIVLTEGANPDKVRESLRNLGFLSDEIGEVKKVGKKRIITVPNPHPASIEPISALPGIASVRGSGRRQTYCPHLDG